MSDVSGKDRPGLASTQRGRQGPFAALLGAASRDPAAARGLALAYASLDGVARRRIVEAVVADARAEGIAAGPALIPLLAVEDDADIARALADAISVAGPDAITVTTAARALVRGDESEGAALVLRPLHGPFVEGLAIAWTRAEGITCSWFEPLLAPGDTPVLEARLADGAPLEETPLAFAVDLLAPVLWRHRRAGRPTPAGIERFADLFSLAR